jgi:AcrR family transcriptional regulator
VVYRGKEAVVPDPESTKRRIFEAAVEEFAEYGSAGARVDRIAAKAKANKESIYRYFGTKEELLRRVIDQYIDELGEQMVPNDADLVEYADNVSRFHVKHPEFLRMALWEGLEFHGELDGDSLERRRQHYAEKLVSVRQQQRDGTIDPDLDPRQLLAVVFGMVNYWFTLPQRVKMLFGGEVTDADLAAYRDFTGECIRRIIAPHTQESPPDIDA